jgi:NAD(P)-dependent dehydrogenase (short-subunit alcohol dehydrogenase family)
MVAACLERFGRIDILVNNVGGSAAGGPVEMSEEVWDAQVDLNLKSVFLGCKHVLPVMQRQQSGAIVNLASTSGLRWTGAAQVAYAATKAGIIQLSRVVAMQYAAQGIRVNTVVPGSCTRRWWNSASRNSAPAATSRRCSPSGASASRSASKATAATPPARRCSSPPTKRASSPAPRSWSTAA